MQDQDASGGGKLAASKRYVRAYPCVCLLCVSLCLVFVCELVSAHVSCVV